MGYIVATVVSVISIVLFLYCVVYAVIKFAADFKNRSYDKESEPELLSLNKQEDKRKKFRRFLLIALITIATRFFIYVIGYYAYCTWYDVNHEFVFFTRIFARSDAPHYLNIATEGYVQYGLNRYWLVFLPLYPWSVGLINTLCNDLYFSAYFVSNLYLCIAAYYLFETVNDFYGKKAGKWAVALLLLYPASFFYAGPFSESLFIMVCILVFYNIHRGNIFAACVFGFFAALTRNIGVFLAVPIGIEILLKYNPFYSKDWKTFIKKALWLLIIPIGTLIYLYLNYKVSGNPLKFLTYEQEYWGQKTAMFFDSVYRLTYYMLHPYVYTKWTHVFPQLAAIFFTQIVMVLYAKKMRTSHLIFSLIYFQLTIGLTALLSAPRYLMVLVPIYYVLAQTCSKNKKAAILISGAFFAYLVFLTCAFAIGFPIY